jgi:WS/DGAT/MGAT family acyltransferase
MVDGISGVDLLTVILSPSADSTFTPAPPWVPRPVPSGAALVAGELWRRTRASFGLLRSMANTLAHPRSTAESVWDSVAGFAELFGETMTPASDTPLNQTIGPHRRFDWLRLDLATVKAIKKKLGGTVNDVVVATVAGAVRRFLLARGISSESLDFRIMIPVSVRSRSERGNLGNKVAQLLAHAPVAERDPRARLAKVVATTTALKQSHQLAATELLQGLSDWTATSVLSQMMRLSTVRRTFNLIVTNVPGPPIELYLLGAPLRATYPMVPLFSNQGVGVALFSYTDGLYFGISADWDAVPDLHDFVAAIASEFELLVAAAGVESRFEPERVAVSG